MGVTPNFIEIAQELQAEGYNPLPLKDDKSPMLESEHGFLYSKIDNIPDRFKRAKKLGIACGPVSDGFYCIDFDCHQGQNIQPIFDEFFSNQTIQYLLNNNEIIFAKSPSGGYHAYFKIGPNQPKIKGTVLSRYPDNKVMIELRGDGMYVATLPSEGYIHLNGPEFSKLATIEPDQLNWIIDLAKSFSAIITTDRDEQGNQRTWTGKWDNRKIDGRFNNEQGEYVKSLLREAGWKLINTRRHDKVELWQRPGKDVDQGISATFGAKPNMFYVFSSNAQPFQEQTPYNPFQIYTLLKFGGDWKAAKDSLKPIPSEEISISTQKFADLAIESDSPQKAVIVEKKDINGITNAMMSYINQYHPFRRNLITKKIEDMNGNEIDSTIINTIHLDMSRYFNSSLVTKERVTAIIYSNYTPNYNPIFEYYTEHSDLKGEGNIDKIIQSITTDTKEAPVWIRKWLIAVHAAAEYNPVRFVLSLVGPQFNGKTEFFRRLWPEPIKRYYAESKLEAGKDDELLMCEKLIVMNDEMGGKTKADEKHFKELTSKAVFSLRAPYDTSNKEYRRLCILCGTSNPSEIINDPTGNTRILPIHVESIDFELFNSVDKDELFMECYRAYKSGESWGLTLDEIKQLSETSQEFQAINYEYELISQHFRPAEDGDGFIEHLTATDIKNYIESNSRQLIKSMTRFGIELRKYFGKSIAKKINGRVSYVYPIIRINPTDTGSGGPKGADLPF